jgi:hypothetical protein
LALYPNFKQRPTSFILTAHSIYSKYHRKTGKARIRTRDSQTSKGEKCKLATLKTTEKTKGGPTRESREHIQETQEILKG